MIPPVSGLIETCLYVDDLPRAREFYRELFGFPLLTGDDRFCALDCAGRQVLLLFRRGASLHPIPVLGGQTIPPHDGAGPVHIGFGIPRDSLAAWEERLRGRGLAVESRVQWPRGGVSLYFRDPDGHAVELLTPGLWATY